MSRKFESRDASKSFVTENANLTHVATFGEIQVWANADLIVKAASLGLTPSEFALEARCYNQANSAEVLKNLVELTGEDEYAVRASSYSRWGDLASIFMLMSHGRTMRLVNPAETKSGSVMSGFQNLTYKGRDAISADDAAVIEAGAKELAGDEYDPEKPLAWNVWTGLIESSKRVSNGEPVTVAAAAPAKQKPEPAPQPANQAGRDQFMSILYDSFVSTCAENLIPAVVPQVRERIIKEFGFEPQRHEVVSAGTSVTIDGITHEKFDVVLNLVANDIPVYMAGPAGSGKNVIAEQVAKGLGKDFYCMNSVTDEFKLTGFVDAGGTYHESEFYRAFTQGGVFFLDEMDASAPEVLVCLNMAIANRYFTFPNGRVSAHEDFRVIAAGNTLGTGADVEYTGRVQLDAASLNRFAIVVVDYDERIDAAMADGDDELVKFVQQFRKAASSCGINVVASYRNIKMMAKMEKFASLKDTIQSCLTKAMNDDDVATVYARMRDVEGNRWHKALAQCGSMM